MLRVVLLFLIAFAPIAFPAVTAGGTTSSLGPNDNVGIDNATPNTSSNVTETVLPPCPKVVRAKYHENWECVPALADRQEYLRSQSYDRLLHKGVGASLVPNQETITCPRHPIQLLQPYEEVSSIPYGRQGLNRMWLVENHASVPIAVYLVYSNGQEVTAVDQTLAQITTHKVINPQQYMAISAYEGRVYHVREYQFGRPGKLLLQHRVGLIPFRSNDENLDCQKKVVKTVSTQKRNLKTGKVEVIQKTVTTNEPDLDNEPIIKTKTKSKKDQKSTTTTIKTDPQYARTPTHANRRCHTIDVGFRNEVGCPLNVYWAAALREIPSVGKSCNETFRFHMGTNQRSQDFMKDWKSATKWEGSFVGHTFVARLKKNESIVVDSYTIQPTRVYDCKEENDDKNIGTASKSSHGRQREEEDSTQTSENASTTCQQPP